jgi:hypothetical protein
MKTLLWATSVAIAGLAFGQSSPSSAALLTPLGISAGMASGSSAGIEPVSYATRYGDRVYGQWWWWSYRHHPGKIHVSKSRYARGCGRHNCYSGKVGFRNRIPITSGTIRYPGCSSVCTYPNPYWPPEVKFGIVVH